MNRLPGSLETMAELHEATAELLSVLEPLLDYITAPHSEQYALREAYSNTAAKLADFENGTDV